MTDPVFAADPARLLIAAAAGRELALVHPVLSLLTPPGDRPGSREPATLVPVGAGTAGALPRPAPAGRAGCPAAPGGSP